MSPQQVYICNIYTLPHTHTHTLIHKWLGASHNPAVGAQVDGIFGKIFNEGDVFLFLFPHTKLCEHFKTYEGDEEGK